MTDTEPADLARFNSCVVRARAEHNREPIHFAVDALCETCQINRRDGNRRKCKRCRLNQDAHRANWHAPRPQPWGHHETEGAA